MADIIRTWPANVDTREAAAMFNETESTYSAYFFAIGRGKPAQSIERVWFTFRGRIVGYFAVNELVIHDGSMEVMTRLNKACGEGTWYIRPDTYVAICGEGFTRAPARRFMSGFRGWRYFDIDAYSATPESRLPV